MLAFSLARCGTGCRNSLVNHCSVTLGRNCFLLLQDFAAIAALAAFGETILGAGRCNSGNRYGLMFGAEILSARITLVILVPILMSGCGNGLFVVAQRHAAHGAVNHFYIFAIGFTGSRLDSFLHGRATLVTLGGNDFLLHNHSAANGAVLTFGLAGLGASSGIALVDNHSMCLCGDGFLLYDNFITYAAVLAFGLTCRSASCRNRTVNHYGMCLLSNFFGIGVALVIFANISHHTRFAAGCCLGNACHIVMALCGNVSLCLQDLTAIRANTSLCLARAFTACRNRRSNALRVVNEHTFRSLDVVIFHRSFQDIAAVIGGIAIPILILHNADIGPILLAAAEINLIQGLALAKSITADKVHTFGNINLL